MDIYRKNGKSTKNQNGVSSTRIQDVPAAIFFHIFLRLQITSVLACKAVCREWYKVIRDPNFISIYGVKAPFVYFANTSNFLRSCCLSFVGVSEKGGDVAETKIDIKIPDMEINGSSLYLVDSCNGFLCFEVINTKSISVYVANPVSRECITLPAFHRLIPRGRPCPGGPMSMACHRFGFSRYTNTLKVVRNSYVKERNVLLRMCDIFTVGVDNAWRSLNHLIDPLWIIANSVFHRGSFHWIGNDSRVSTIKTFVLEEERIGEISYPPGIGEQRNRYNLASLKGNLCLLNGTQSRITVWTMTEYEVTDSWTRNVIVRLTYPPEMLYWKAVVSLLQNGEYLLINNLEKSLVSYNCEKKKYTKVADFDFSHRIIFTPTLKKFIGDDGAV